MTHDWLCVSLSISVPAIFHVSVDLVTNTSTKTVYTVDNVVGETAATDMLTVFEVQLDATQTSYSQLVVYVSEETVIRNVNIQNNLCNSTSKLSIMSTIVELHHYLHQQVSNLYNVHSTICTVNNNNNNNSKTMFMVLSSWQSHCEISPGSFDECRTAPSGRRPKTKADDLGCESACTGCQSLHPPSPFIIITQPES